MQPGPVGDSASILSGLRLGPIMVGVAVDWILTTLFSVALTRSYLDPGIFALEGAERDAAFKAGIELLFVSTDFLLASLLTGMLATVMAAYVGARRAGTLPLKHGLAVALMSGLSVLLVYVLPGEEPSLQVPLWYDALGWVLLVPAGILGGYLARQLASTGSD